MLTSEHGHYFLILALFFAVAQSIFGLAGGLKGWRSWIYVTPVLALAQFTAVGVSFLLLIRAFLVSDFSLRIVAENSHSSKPMLYKIAGAWGNHEGSMLMWVAILALYGAAIAIASRNMPPKFRALVLGVHASIGIMFYLFIELTSNPFIRITSPENGSGLNPILQDPGLAFHPPMLYLGYVGLSVAFSFAIAALIDGRVDATWARFVRPWTLAAWVFLTGGIALGSWWAYYELGWGGFWFWDPVENASFMPWLISVALLHSSVVVEKRDTLKSWTILLAIIAFSFSLIGTFVVRSGVLTSVHSFASDPTRGAFILGMIMFTMLVGFSLYAWRAPKLTPSSAFAPLSRESGIVMNNLLLIVATSVVFIGTIWPLVAEMVFGIKLSVGAPFFDASFTPFMLMLATILPIGAILAWKRARWSRISRFVGFNLVVASVFSFLLLFFQTGWSLTAPVALFLAVWIAFGIANEIWQKLVVGRGFAASWARFRGISGAEWGKYFAHGGLALVILAVGVLRAYQFEDLRAASAPSEYDAGGYHLKFESVETGKGHNYDYTRGRFLVSRGQKIYTLEPEIRQFPVEAMTTTEAAILPHNFGDLYLVMRASQETGVWSVYFYLKPFANVLWLGAFFMMLGGLFSLFDRRMRLGRVERIQT